MKSASTGGCSPSRSRSRRSRALTFGLLPALHLSRTPITCARWDRAAAAASRGESRLRSTLTLAQVALATVLLTGAALLTHSFIRLSTFNKGYDPANVLAFNLLFPDTYSTARKGETIEALLTRFRSNPGVRAAGFARHGLLIGEELYIGRFVPPGQDARGRGSEGIAHAIGQRRFPHRDGRADPAGPRSRRRRLRRRARCDRDQSLRGTPRFRRANPDRSVDGMGRRQDAVAHDGRRRGRGHAAGGGDRPAVPEIFVDYRQYLRFHDVDRPRRVRTKAPSASCRSRCARPAIRPR